MFGKPNPIALVRRLVPVHFLDEFSEIVDPRNNDEYSEIVAELAAVRWMLGRARKGTIALRSSEYFQLQKLEQTMNPFNRGGIEARADRWIVQFAPDWEPAEIRHFRPPPEIHWEDDEEFCKTIFGDDASAPSKQD